VGWLASCHWDPGTKAQLFDAISGQRTSGKTGWSISDFLYAGNGVIYTAVCKNQRLCAKNRSRTLFAIAYISSNLFSK
jgi:hypothetical protein